MPTRDDYLATAPLADALEAMHVPYYIGGSVASSLHGVGRSTIDVDIVAQLQYEHVQRLVSMLKDAFYIDAPMIYDAIANRSSFNVIHLPTSSKIDIFIPPDTSFHRAGWTRLAHGRAFEDGKREFPIASPEDVILNKLEWYRLGGETSERQWLDVLGVLRVQAGNLDTNYLNQWAAQLDVTDLLSRAFAEAQL